VNSRKDIGQAFALYWKITTLKCHANRCELARNPLSSFRALTAAMYSTPQEAKLDRVSTRLLQVPGLEQKSLQTCACTRHSLSLRVRAWVWP
jgi:hypothetical protein